MGQGPTGQLGRQTVGVCATFRLPSAGRFDSYMVHMSTDNEHEHEHEHDSDEGIPVDPEDSGLLSILGVLFGDVPDLLFVKVSCPICDHGLAQINQVMMGPGNEPYAKVSLNAMVKFATSYMFHVVKEHGGEPATEVVGVILEQLERAIAKQERRDNAPKN